MALKTSVSQVSGVCPNCHRDLVVDVTIGVLTSGTKPTSGNEPESVKDQIIEAALDLRIHQRKDQEAGHRGHYHMEEARIDRLLIAWLKEHNRDERLPGQRG